MNKNYNVGDIIAAKATYTWETLFWKFYKVVKTTNASVYLQELERDIIYDDGKTGPHYYNDPYHYAPRKYNGEYVPKGEVFRRKVKVSPRGNLIVKPDLCFTAVNTWDGTPLEGYNYH